MYALTAVDQKTLIIGHLSSFATTAACLLFAQHFHQP
jgi:hypothetical protein